MHRIAAGVVGIFSLVCLAGCSGLKQIQDTMTKFDEGVHSVATAEMNFFRAVQTADCSNQFYAKAYEYAVDNKGSFDLTGACTPTILDDKEILIRQALMDSITLYADKMVALATSDSDKSLDANAQKLAGRINGLAKQGGFSDLSLASGVQSAIIAISEMALDQKRFDNLRESASAMAPHLKSVVDALKSENVNFAYGIAGKTAGVEGYLREVVAATHHEQGQLSFFRIVQARRIVQSVNPFSPETIAASAGGGDLSRDPHNVALQINVTLDSVVNANQAIAGAGTGGLIAAVNDLVVRAKAAQNVQGALNQ